MKIYIHGSDCDDDNCQEPSAPGQPSCGGYWTEPSDDEKAAILADPDGEPIQGWRFTGRQLAAMFGIE